jgi:hypothetical protein
VLNDEERNQLQQFYGQLSLDPLEPGDSRYVPLYADNADEDPVVALGEAIELSPGGSTQLLSGYRGAGKSTELRRLQKSLTESNYAVVLIDVEDYLNTAAPVDIVDFLLALGGAFEAGAERGGALPTGGGRRHFWDRVGDLLSRIQVDSTKVALPGNLAEVQLSLKGSSEFTARLRENLSGSLGALVADLRAFVADVIKDILNHSKAVAVVLLVDSVEHFRGTLTTDADVQASIENLFFNQADNLQFENLHVVYTVPPYLKTRAGGVAALYRPGTPLQVIPAVKVKPREGFNSESHGLIALRSVVEQRGDWEFLLGDNEPGTEQNPLNRLCLASGGHLRDLIRLLQEITRRGLRVDSLPVPDRILAGAIDQIAREFLPIADDDAQALWRVHEDHDSPLESISGGLTTLSRFLDTHLLLCYRNGREWYDIHPLIVDDVYSQIGRIRERRAEVRFPNADE